MNIDKSNRNVTTTKSFKKSVILTSLSQETDEPSSIESTGKFSSLPLSSTAPNEPKFSVLKIPFIGRAPMKTVSVPRAIVESEPPTVKTAKTVLCSYKVTCHSQLFIFLSLFSLSTIIFV